jgi:predicted Ser/Thr protein kinase
MTPNFLAETVQQVRDRFVAEKTILSFQEYLEVVRQAPAHQARDSATYVRDCWTHFGTTRVTRPYGQFTRWNLFDCPFDGGRDPLIGHEAVQAQVFGLLSDFVREGRVNKLVLLHGPNGSAKSSFIGCVLRALEHYSAQPEGALYSFNWVFPSRKTERGAIGFGSTGRGLDGVPSYAHLADADIDARVRNELRDHPLLLLPAAARRALLRELLGEATPLPALMTDGDLSPRARAISDALLKAYQGDLAEVLRHVQVERFYISRRYRSGAVTVDPQLRVDAGARQVTSDRSLGALPPVLQNLSLYEAVGDLVDANRGVIEYNDLLKRPLESFKYLLATCEKGTASLDMMTLHLDEVFLASSNANHLDAFMEMPDFASFKARIELVEVPYLVDFEQERRIYVQQIRTSALRRPVAPHTDRIAALWAVLTRLHRPTTDRAPAAVRAALEQLTPLQKAELYASGKTSSHLSRDVANELKADIESLYRESHDTRRYEGRTGASPRELKAALLGAARREGFRSLSPIALLEELTDLVRQSQVYDWLRLEPDGEYHQPEAAIEAVRAWYLDLVEEELHRAMGLIDVDRTVDLFKRYVDHVTYFVRREKRQNPITGRAEDPDETLMSEVERRLGLSKQAALEARAGLLSRIAAWRMDNPDAPLDLAAIFAEQHARLTESFYEEKRVTAERVKRNLLVHVIDDPKRLTEEERAQSEQTLETLERDFGYDRACATDVIGYLLKMRQRSA